MSRYIPTRAWNGSGVFDMRVRKRSSRENERDMIERAARKAPFRALYFALRVRGEWRIYTTGRHREVPGKLFTYVYESPQLVLTVRSSEAADMWLMHRGWNDG